ncbi:MAG: sigma-70 family RNA polymerase sigma factor [Erysipelotrichaceae bacterium]|nr:sigma-70 family RNA polymerase sigma factor [Erysipelotrichaceae bacterium]
MGFNYAEEYKKWLEWKEEEEELLRTLKVPESTIKELRTYDWNEFKRERSIVSRQVPTKEIFFVVRPTMDKKDIFDVEDLLNEINNEDLYMILSNTDRATLNILLLRILGYTMDEVSKITGIPRSSIYYRIHSLKEKIKKI